jgi:hypothetical protein
MEQEQQTSTQRALELIRVLLPNWQPTTQDVLRWIRVALAVGLAILGVLLILDVIGLLFGITLLKLLKVLAIPITVGAAVPLLNWLQKKRELDVENQRAQDEALKAYLDQMGQLLLDKDRPLRQSKEGDELRTLARARTKDVLWKLDLHRKRNLLQFLHEASLIKRENNIIDLSGADLRSAYLWKVDFKNADLRGADIKGADLSEADLSEADLRGSMLGGADLREADLSGANLREAKEWTEDQLTAAHLEGATMPNGQKYEDWLKDREGHGEDG